MIFKPTTPPNNYLWLHPYGTYKRDPKYSKPTFTEYVKCIEKMIEKNEKENNENNIKTDKEISEMIYTNQIQNKAQETTIELLLDIRKLLMEINHNMYK